MDDCKERQSVKFITVPGIVRFEWEITSPDGLFVEIGCSKEKKKAEGEYVIFKPPYVPLPVLGAKEATVTTIIKLRVIDDNPGPLEDETIERTVTIITKRIADTPDNYKVSVEQETLKPGKEEKFESVPGDCKPLDIWSGFGELKVPVIILPKDVKDNDKLLAGEWITLEADKQTDTDHLSVICQTKLCEFKRLFNMNYPDPLQWSWSVNKGKFAGSGKSTDKGRVV